MLLLCKFFKEFSFIISYCRIWYCLFGVLYHVIPSKVIPFANNDRIAPIYVVPEIGYVLTLHKEGDVAMSKGVSFHCYESGSNNMLK